VDIISSSSQPLGAILLKASPSMTATMVALAAGVDRTMILQQLDAWRKAGLQTSPVAEATYQTVLNAKPGDEMYDPARTIFDYLMVNLQRIRIEDGRYLVNVVEVTEVDDDIDGRLN
jgi:hypothetical protein